MALRKKKPECIGCGENKLDMLSYNYDKYTLCSDGEAPSVTEIDWNNYLLQNN